MLEDGERKGERYPHLFCVLTMYTIRYLVYQQHTDRCKKIVRPHNINKVREESGRKSN